MEDNNNKNIQGLLGFSSKEKILYVVYSDDNETIYVYMGLTLMWTIPNDHNSFIFKSTIVAIAKAGIRIKDIEDAFNISFKTIKKYLKAFEDNHTDEELKNALKNPGRQNYKLNDEIQNYIYERIEYYQSIGKKRFSKIVRNEVNNKFNVDFSTEKIRQIKIEYNETSSKAAPSIRNKTNIRN